LRSPFAIFHQITGTYNHWSTIGQPLVNHWSTIGQSALTVARLKAIDVWGVVHPRG
jgi:hypothetical protein